MRLDTHRMLMLSAVVLCGCQSMPDDTFRLTQTALQTRALQTREFHAVDDEQILSASMAVLQDMGYAIDEVEQELGVLSASKRADADNELQILGSLTADAIKCVFTLLLGCTGAKFGKTDDVQDIRLTLVSRPLPENRDNVAVRVTLQRVIWDRKGRISKQETIVDSDVYVAFFNKLNTAVFLEQEAA